jgi:hypothetical protein
VAIRHGHEPHDTFVVSIHVNAAGSGRMWHSATGWCAYTFPGHTESDKAGYLSVQSRPETPSRPPAAHRLQRR